MAAQAIRGALAHLGLAAVPAPAPHGGRVARREVVLREAPGDTLARDWRNFDPVAADVLLGTRADGRAVRAQRAGCVLFPFPESQVDQEWFTWPSWMRLGSPDPRQDPKKTAARCAIVGLVAA